VSSVASVKAFTLVELLVGAVLGSLVIGALGGALLVSQMRVSAAIRRDLDRKDALNRAVALIRSEISTAEKISVGLNGLASNICASSGSQSSLVLSSAGARDICYKAVRRTSISGLAVPSSGDRPWSGDCVLMRQGPPYDPATGEILWDSSLFVFQVILDDLAGSPGSCLPQSFRFELLGSGNSSTVSRDVDITITQSSGPPTHFSARSGSNPLYSGLDMSGTASPGIPACDPVTQARHIRVGSSLPAVDNQCRNIYYVPNVYSASSIGSCSSASCTVNGITLSNVDVLVFSDREIRP